jgi:hypothetical protein
MPRTGIVLLAVAATLLLAGCGGDPEFAGDLTIPMAAQNESGFDGEAMLEEVDDDTTRVTIELRNPSEDSQPAHIHKGSCENLDPQPAYPLDNVADGASTTEVDVALGDLVGQGYAVNVHKSAAEAEVYVACGDIEESAGEPGGEG